MDVHELIRSRTSIRRYKTATIPFEIVLKIMHSACRAPSAANMQCWRFIIVNDSTQKRAIAEACAHNINARACEAAPYIIVLCADPKKSVVKNGIDYFLFDCGLAMENLLLAAQAEGFSTCIVAWFDAKKVRRALNVPGSMSLVALTTLGYRDEAVKYTPRKSLEKVVFCNGWEGSINNK